MAAAIPPKPRAQSYVDQDTRLVHALREFIPEVMRHCDTPGLNIALARHGDVI